MVVPEERPKAIVVVLDSQISSKSIPRLCENLRAVLEASDADVVVCDVGTLVAASPVTLDVLDALARLQLTAKRVGRRLHVANASSQLRTLLTLTGLSETLLLDPP